MEKPINNKNSNPKSLEQRNFMRFAQQIDDIKKPISTALGGVLEYQKNDEKYISIKFFNSNNKEITNQDIENAHMFIHHYNNKINRIKEELMQEPNISNPQKKMLLSIIHGISLRSLLLYYATYIEAEKGGYIIDPEEKCKYLNKVEKLESILYGEKISNTEKEKEIIINHLQHTFNKGKSLLTEDQKQEFELFLNKFGGGKEIKEKIPKEQKEENITSERISKRKVCEIFKKILDIYGIKNKIIIIQENIFEEKESDGVLYIPKEYDQKQRADTLKKYTGEKTVKIILDKNLPNFGIGDYKVDVPDNGESITIKRVCELIDHELGIHLPRELNKDTGINIRTEGYLEIEEGIATMNEKLATEKRENIDIDEPTIHNVSTLIGENYNFNETKNLLSLYYLLQGKTPIRAEKLSEQRALRVKRYHAFDLPGANRKDVVYRRGLVDAVEYIKHFDKNKKEDIQKLQEDIGNFFISKIGKEETFNADKIFEGFTIDKKKLIMPMAIGKIINEKLIGKTINPNDDIRFLASSQKLDYQQKKKILEIINFLKEDINKET